MAGAPIDAEDDYETLDLELYYATLLAAKAVDNLLPGTTMEVSPKGEAVEKMAIVVPLSDIDTQEESWYIKRYKTKYNV